MRNNLGVLIASCFLLASCSRVKTTVDYDKSADFSRYSSFAWNVSDEETRDIVLPINRDVWLGVRQGVAADLRGRGLAETSKENADLVMQIDGGVSNREIRGSGSNRSEAKYDFDPSRGDSDFADLAVGGEYSGYSRGRLRLTVRDRGENRIVWVGTVEGVVDEFSSTREEVRMFVSNLMKKFPR